MKNLDPETYSLDNFEGPLDFLLHLIQKHEIDIYDIPLHKITEQFLKKWGDWLEPDIDSGAEFIGTTSSLLWLKSKTLLPKHEQPETPEELEADPRFEIIHQLLDYCRFKQAAKELTEREMHQSAHYFRGGEAVDVKKNLGIDHLSLQDLALMFQQILSKAKGHKGQVHEEIWKVADKITWIRHLLISQQKIEFGVLFAIELSREELIVTFLALLEMMKMGELRVIKDPIQQRILIVS